METRRLAAIFKILKEILMLCLKLRNTTTMNLVSTVIASDQGPRSYLERDGGGGGVVWLADQ